MTIQQQLAKQYAYMTEQFGLIRAELAGKVDKSDIDHLRVAIDGLHGDNDRLDSEQAATDSHISRVERRVEDRDMRLKKLEQAA